MSLENVSRCGSGFTIHSALRDGLRTVRNTFYLNSRETSVVETYTGGVSEKGTFLFTALKVSLLVIPLIALIVKFILPRIFHSSGDTLNKTGSLKTKKEAVDEVQPAVKMYEGTRLDEFLKGKGPAPKLFQIPTPFKLPSFKHLSRSDLEKLLVETLPEELKRTQVNNSAMTADRCIIQIHEKGFPEYKSLSASSNQELITQMRYIIFCISQEKERKKQEKLLGDIVDCLEKCVPDIQGRLGKVFMKLACHGEGQFESQMQAFLNQLKDEAIDQALLEVFPEMGQDDYMSKIKGKPYLGFSHVKNGFIKVHGEKIGFIKHGAASDPHANGQLPQTHGDKFLEAFHRHFQLANMIKRFLITVNGNGERGDIILNLTFYSWMGANGFTEDDFYFDEKIEYPDYSPKPCKQQTDFFAVYISEKVGVRVFERLGYIQPRVSV